MAKNSFQFDVALGKNNYIPIGEVKQSDTMDFSIRVLENDVVKNLTGDTCTLYVSKQDGTILEQKEGINITEATSGTLTIRVKNQATACPGMTFFELEFKGADGIATSGTFLFTVNARVASGEAIQSKDEIQALEQVEKYVKEAKAELQKFKELQAAMLETNNSLNNQEELRVEAESLRVTAEEGRVAAETKREETFNEFEGRITANTEELKAARSATTGENFDSIDERIDCEVNRINKKIEISFLEQEDKESHAIENTVEGITTDMIIKGRTLHNLSCSKLVTVNVGQVFNNIISTLSLLQGGKTYTIIYNLTKASSATERCTPYLQDITGATVYEKPILNYNTSAGVKKWCITLDSSFIPTQLCFWVQGHNSDVEVKDFIILEGDWINKSIPEYFEGTKSFGEQEGDEISILSENTEIPPEFNFTIEKIYTDNNVDYNSIVFLNNKNITGKMNINKLVNKDAHRLRVYGLNEKPINNTISEILSKKIWDSGDIFNTSLEFNLKSCNYLVILGYSLFQNDFDKNYKITFNINKKQDKKNILLTKYGFDEGLKGINNTLYDELNEVKNKAVKRIEKYTFTGNENIERRIMVEESKTIGFGIKVSSLENLKIGGKCISNNFKYAEPDNCWNADKECISIYDFLHFRIDKTKLTTQDVEGFKTWLKANQTTIFYELAEPVETPLTENINAKIFDEKAYIRFENALSGTSSFKVPVNATATISRLNRENKALEAENLRLKKGTYKNSEDIILTNEELQITQSAVDHLLFGAVETAMLYNGKKKGGGSMGAYLAMRIIKGKLKYDAVMKQYGEFKEDIDLILKAEGYDHLITQQ